MEQGEGLQALYAGRGMTMWRTPEEAEASYDAPLSTDRIERTPFAFWRSQALMSPGGGITREILEAFRDQFDARKHDN